MSSLKKNFTLSKSRIMRGLQCAKNLYLSIHQHELESPVTESQQAIFDQGHRVGILAQEQYPGGVLITAPYNNTQLAVTQTQEAINKGYNTIYEATFSSDGLMSKIDILHRAKTGQPWQLIEVKSSTSVKPEHLSDVATQALVLQKSGIECNKMTLMHINNQAIAPKLVNLFNEVDISEEIKPLIKETHKKIESLKKLLTKSEAPDIDIGPHCDEPYECPFKSHCWKHIPKDSIFEIPSIGKKAWEYYNEGIVEISDARLIPSKSQENRVKAVRSGTRFVDKESIKEGLSSWKWPLYYLDFETIGYAIPFHEGTHPYEQIPFQFSCLVQQVPYGQLIETYYLHDEPTDPRPGLISKLLQSLQGTGSIVAYNMGFEKKCIEGLAKFNSKQSKDLYALTERLVDPLPIFRSSVYDKGFAGSFSLKKVVPTILGNNHSYENMEVQNGEATQRYFLELISPNTPKATKVSHKKAMLDYCRKDTQEMADLVAWLIKQG